MRIDLTAKFAKGPARKFSVGVCAAKSIDGVVLIEMKSPTMAKAIAAVQAFCATNKACQQAKLVSVK